MATERVQALCKPDDTHWCCECCEDRNCLNFNELEDGTWGCLGYNLKTNKKVITLYDGSILVTPQLEICRKTDCLEGTGLNREEVRQKIQSLPPGEFQMSMVIQEFTRK